MSEDTNLYLYNFGRSCMQSFMGFYSCICSGLAAGRLCKVLDLLNIYLHRGRNFGKKVKAAPTEEKEEECQKSKEKTAKGVKYCMLMNFLQLNMSMGSNQV